MPDFNVPQLLNLARDVLGKRPSGYKRGGHVQRVGNVTITTMEPLSPQAVDGGAVFHPEHRDHFQFGGFKEASETAPAPSGLGGSSPLEQTFQQENIPAAVVSPKPGQEYGQIAPAQTKNMTSDERVNAIARSAMPILEGQKVRDLVKKHFKINNYKIHPVTGTWNQEPEPSFVIEAPGLNPAKARKLAHAFSFGMWQDAAVHRTHDPNVDINSGVPTLMLGHGKELTNDEKTRILLASKKYGHDLTFSKDNKAAIFSHYGEPSEHENFLKNVKNIAQESDMPEILAVRTAGDLDEAKKYLPQIMGSAAKRARDQRGTSQPSDLFRDLVDHVLTPYTKAASEHGYRFSAERFADHHQLTDAERDYVYNKLIPAERRTKLGVGRTTIKDPVGYEYPAVYGDPRALVSEAASRVAKESPNLKSLFGVTRDDLYHIGANRVGNMEPVLKMTANPRGSEAAQRVMTPKNEQRILDIIDVAKKYDGLKKGMMPWYVMDPLFDRMVRIFGHNGAVEQYKKLNTLMSMASPGSEVPTEINRGFAAYYLQHHNRFDDFINYAGLPGHKRGEDFPADIADVMGHMYHKTSQAGPMERYLKSGEIEMGTPKVPTYIPASGVPQTGFQTTHAVPDAHFTRLIGMGEARTSGEPGVSMKMPEYQDIQPWWRHNIAGKAGMESVPGQALVWGAGSGATGVSSPIGAPKLEMIADYIAERARRHGISPQKALDLILEGKLYSSGGEVEDLAHGGAPHASAPRPSHPLHGIPGVHIITADAGEPIFHGEL